MLFPGGKLCFCTWWSNYRPKQKSSTEGLGWSWLRDGSTQQNNRLGSSVVASVIDDFQIRALRVGTEVVFLRFRKLPGKFEHKRQLQLVRWAKCETPHPKYDAWLTALRVVRYLMTQCSEPNPWEPLVFNKISEQSDRGSRVMSICAGKRRGARLEALCLVFVFWALILRFFCSVSQ